MKGKPSGNKSRMSLQGIVLKGKNAAMALLFWIQCKLSGRGPADAWREVRPGCSYQDLGISREAHNSRHSLLGLA